MNLRVVQTGSVPALFLGAFFCAIFSSLASAQQKPSCRVPEELTALESALPRTSQHLLAHEPVKIVAIGSSSTGGAGASSPSQSYPNRLEADLAQTFPGQSISVVNRGVNGQDAADMLDRLKTDVVDEHPDLVLWQLGTNAALRDIPLSEVSAKVDQGLAILQDAHIDIVLIDPQFAPRVIAKMPEAEAMVGLIAASASKQHVGLFRRFAVSRYWHDVRELPFETFVSPDGLHMNDWGYDCWAKLLSAAIVDAAAHPTMASAHGVPSAIQTAHHQAAF